MQRLREFLERMPSTNARIAVTLLCVIGTAVRFLGWGAPERGWEAWLWFLAAMAGLDIAQFASKRLTHREPKAGGADAAH